MPDSCQQREVEDSKPFSLEERRLIIEEYARDLREIIKQLRRKLN